MKAKLQKLIRMAVLGLVMFSQSIPTWAGQKVYTEVEVGTHYARGGMVGARYSSDNRQYIGCVITGGYDFLHCSAQDKTGKTYVCSVSTEVSQKWEPAIRAMTDTSVIQFGGPYLSGQGPCTYLFIENHSSHLK